MPPSTSAYAPSDPERLARAFAEERHRLVLGRLRWAARMAFLPITASILVNTTTLDRTELGAHLATLGVQAGLCVVVLALCIPRRAERWSIALAMGLTMGMGTSLFWSLSLAADDLHILVAPIACVLLGSALVFPWGAWPQLVVSLYVAVGYLVFPPWPALDPMRAMNVHLSLGLGLGVSVFGAWVLDGQRYATFVERERVATLAREAELLAAVGRDLNGTLALSELVQRVTDHGHALVGADVAALTLVDERNGVVRMVTTVGEAKGPSTERGLEFRLSDVAPFLEHLAVHGCVQLPEGGLAPVHAMNRSFGYERTLYAPIQRDGRLLAVLAFLQHAALPSFTEHQVRLADGIAHQAAIALANARLVEDLQLANQLKSEFVSTMSHELRTPLHVILGYTDMIEELTEAERTTAIARIRNAGRELLELIEATLNVSRIEARKDPATIAPVRLRELWDELAVEFAPLVQNPRTTLHWEPIVDVIVLTDRRKLKIILKNLVSNALKFTPAGEVVVACDGEDPVCRFRVRDTGVGIASADLPFIFEMFRQVDSSDSRSYGGAGLGLYIVRRMVEQLGGTVSVESTPGQGSTFSVALPAAGPGERREDAAADGGLLPPMRLIA